MPAESTASVLIVAAATMATGFFAGAAAVPDADHVTMIAKEAQEVSEISEASVFWFSLAGGVGGAFIAIAFGLYRGTTQQLALRFVGSATLACLCTPVFMLWRDFPLTMSYILPVSGAFGLLAYGLVMSITPLLFEWLPNWFKRKFLMPESQKPTEKLSP